MQPKQAGKATTSKGGRPPKPPMPAPTVQQPEALKPAALGRSNDEDLMRRTQQGDRQAFSLLYERYSASVLSYLYRMLGNVEDVESIGQEVFLRAFRFAATYRYPQKFSTWLFTITRNLAINQSRRRKPYFFHSVLLSHQEAKLLMRRGKPSRSFLRIQRLLY